jgi:flavin reductase (DIM6/NTAB) family NADH-FMN oxidoreductase RutF
MSHFLPVDLAHASRLLNHGPTVLVTSCHEGRRNVMAAAWSMPVEFTPPRVAVVIDKQTLTKQFIGATGVFGLCIPGRALADFTFSVGSVSGREQDKFAHHGLTPLTGTLTGVPLLETGCSAWMECRLIPEPHTEAAYDTCFAEVLAAAADPRIFRDGRWAMDASNADLHTLHHVGAGRFVPGEGLIQAQLR